MIVLIITIVLLIIKLAKIKNEFYFYFKKNSQLYNLAFKDELTGILNRNAYIRDLKKLERKKLKSLWFCIFDIDDFKSMNDANGHLYGDKILIAAAQRLGKIFVGDNHSVYRIGGDEFLVISKNISEDGLIELMLKIREEEIVNSDFRFSKGYSYVQNTLPNCYDIAFDNADKMLYADKKSKKQEALI